MKPLLAAFVAGLIVMAGAGYWWEHRPAADLNSDVLNGVRSLNRLVVFQAYLTAITDKQDCWAWPCPFTSTQTMISPAYVNYYVDLDKVSLSSLSISDRELVVRLPPLMIERPNIDTVNVRIFNSGIWSTITGANTRLERENRPQAVKQLSQRAKMSFLVGAARRQAISAVLNDVRGILKAAGRSDLSISVTF